MKNKLPSFGTQLRDYTALISGFIYNLNVFGISAKNICSPGFNCHGCPWATFSCPVGVIGYGFGVRSIPAFALASVFAIGLVSGRFVCGYLCPFGLLQELLYRIKTRKFALPRPVRYLKYIIMLLTVFLLTWIFGFEAENAYIKVNKPVLALDGSSFDVNIFAEKNQEYFVGYTVDNKIDSFTATDLNAEEDSEIKAVGVGGGFGEGGGDLFADLLDDTVEEVVPEDAAGDESVYDFLQRAKEEEFEGAEILVEVTADNLSDSSLESITLTPAFYDIITNEEIWRGEDMVIDTPLAAGESFTTGIFKVPYYLHKANFVVLSPQTVVKQDYSTLFCTYCPVGTLEADIPGALADTENAEQVIYIGSKLNLSRLLITAFVLLGSVFISRFFCRAFCPLGALYGLFSRFSVIKVSVEMQGCISCGKCDTVCPMGLDVRKEAGGSECIACGNCLRSCPTKTIKRKIGL